MSLDNYLKKKSFLIYGLGLTGVSVVKFFNRNKIKNYYVWDDIKNKLYKNKRPKNIYKVLKKVDYIILSPGINLRKSKNKKKLIKFKKKIITDIDLIYLFKKDFKSIVVTGTNGKSTTCKIIDHVLKKNKLKTLLGGNIGKPILDFKIKKYNYVIIEASSFQLAYSKFIRPDHAILLNIANDHLDWHGNMRNYINSKFKIFALQKKSQYSFVNKNLQNNFINRKLSGKLIIPRMQDYNRIKNKVKNDYIKTNINNENMSNVVALAKILKIKEKSFITSLNSFKGLPHRYEVFLKKKNVVFINDSKATTFEATKPALQNTKNIYWILGGLPKKMIKLF